MTGSILGRVTNEGAPVAGVRVAATAGYGGAVYYSATTGADGAYHITGMPPDSYILTVAKPRHASVTAGQATKVDIAL